MALVQRLQGVHDRMKAVAASFGIPQYQNVVMVHNGTQTLLTPQPKVESMSKYEVMEFLSNNVEVNNDLIWLNGVSRIYDDSILTESSFILNATRLDNNSPWVGINADIRFIDRNQLMTWRILVSPYRRR